MINIIFNNNATRVNSSDSLNELLTAQGYQATNYFAIVINSQFLARRNYATTLLKEGDVVEIIMPMQGG